MTTPPPPPDPPSSPPPLVELRNVTCGYGTRVILENVDLKLPRGKLVGLMGTSGGG